MAAHAEADACVTGIVGCAGLRPTVAAIESGKDICLANKETLIAGGPFVLPLAKASRREMDGLAAAAVGRDRGGSVSEPRLVMGGRALLLSV